MSVKKRFKVTVDGRQFDVEVEEVQDASGPIGAKPAQRPAATPAAAPAKAAPAAAPGVVSAPMAGKVLKVPVSVGAKVKAGDVLVVLEAMKMETNVNAGSDGEVKEILVKEGDSVDAGAGLVKVE